MIRKLLSKVEGDRYIWLIMICLAIFSILSVYSASGTLAFRNHSGQTEIYLFRHSVLILMGLGLMVLASKANYRIYSRLAQILLWVSIPLLLITLIFGSDINDARRWITVPVIHISFQTSDLAKVALIMYVARFLSRRQEDVKDFYRGYLPIILIITLVTLLIAIADLSSAAVLFATSLLLLFIGRVRLRYIAATVVVASFAFAFMVLLAYQFPHVGRLGTWKSRIESFVSSDQEPAYHVQQSKIAIAEGGILGKGPGNSIQKNFLPNSFSDYIFSVIIEEYGLLGAGFLIFLYLAFLYRSVKIVIRSPGTFGALLAAGLAFSLVIQALVNMAVAVDLLPSTGLPLPLVSMGGTSLWFTGLAVGIILSVSRQSDKERAAEAEEALTDLAEEKESSNYQTRGVWQ